MVNLAFTTPRERRILHQETLECQSYEVTEAIDPRVTWTYLGYEIEGHEGRSV
jgi:hypothetical protein